MDNTTYLHQTICFLSDFPRNHTLCFDNPASSSSEDGKICFNCLWVSLYLFDGDGNGEMNSNNGCLLNGNCLGNTLSKILAYLAILTGIIGSITNVLIVFILKKGTTCGPSLTALLIPLSVCDFLTSFFTVIFVSFIMLMWENVSRSECVLKTMYISMTVGYFSRTTSMFIAVLITVERYCVVSKPLKFKGWFTLQRTQWLCAAACVLSILINTPRWFDAEWEVVGMEKLENRLPSYQHYPYVAKLTQFGYTFYDKFCEMYFVVDFLVPLPTLLVFNYLIYREIRSSNKNRKKLQCLLVQKEIDAAKMFTWVVAVLVLCHIIPIIFHIIIGVFKLAHREIGFAAILSVTINSSINFIIYCAFGEQFREQFARLILSCPGIRQIWGLCHNKQQRGAGIKHVMDRGKSKGDSGKRIISRSISVSSCTSSHNSTTVSGVDSRMSGGELVV